MSFKHKLQPVSTSALLGLSSSLVSSSNSPLPFSVPLPYLFYAVVPFPPLPPSLCLHPPPHPACLPTVAPQVGNISFKQVKLMPCRLAITRFCQPVWTVFTNFVHTIFSLFCFYNILGCSCFRFIEGVLSTEWNKTCEWKKFFIDGICKKKKEMSYMFKILHFALWGGIFLFLVFLWLWTFSIQSVLSTFNALEAAISYISHCLSWFIPCSVLYFTSQLSFQSNMKMYKQWTAAVAMLIIKSE